MAKTTRKSSRLALTRRRNAAKRLRAQRNSALGRLDADGASASNQINRRALWLASEWQLPRCPRIGRTLTKPLVDYCQAYGVRLEWLVHGNLRSLQQMMETRRMGPAAVTSDSLREKFGCLSESEREIVRKKVDELMEGRT